jgi:hypothetical protein
MVATRPTEKGAYFGPTGVSEFGVLEFRCKYARTIPLLQPQQHNAGGTSTLHASQPTSHASFSTHHCDPLSCFLVPVFPPYYPCPSQLRPGHVTGEYCPFGSIEVSSNPKTPRIGKQVVEKESQISRKKKISKLSTPHQTCASGYRGDLIHCIAANSHDGRRTHTISARYCHRRPLYRQPGEIS